MAPGSISESATIWACRENGAGIGLKEIKQQSPLLLPPLLLTVSVFRPKISLIYLSLAILGAFWKSLGYFSKELYSVLYVWSHNYTKINKLLLKMPRYKVKECGHRPSNFLGTTGIISFENNLRQDRDGTLPFNDTWIISVYYEYHVQLQGRD